jgi:hypothetical protein
MSSFDEEISMQLRRATRSETISSDIALRLAEMVFVRHYSHLINEQLPLEVTDRGDRWEVHGKGTPGERLRMVVMKIDGRIVDLVAW